MGSFDIQGAIETVLILLLLYVSLLIIGLFTPMQGETCSAHPKSMLSNRLTKKKLPKDIDYIVIGGGVSGLFLAASLAKFKYKVVVLEQHDVLGGGLHTFNKSGYKFETGFHYMGSPGIVASMIQLLSGMTLHFHKLGIPEDNFTYDRVILKDDEGTSIDINYPDSFAGLLENIKKEFKNPTDIDFAEKFLDSVVEVGQLFKIQAVLKVLPKWVEVAARNWFPPYKKYLKYSSLTVADMLTGTKNEKLKIALTAGYGNSGGPLDRISFIALAIPMMHYSQGAFVPKGGPDAIVKTLVRTIESCGGHCFTNADVSSYIIQGEDGSLSANSNIADEVLEHNQPWYLKPAEYFMKLIRPSPCCVGVQVRGMNIFSNNIVSSISLLDSHGTLMPTKFRKRLPMETELAMYDSNSTIDDVNNGGRKPTMPFCTNRSSSGHFTAFIGLDKTAAELNLPSHNTLIYRTGVSHPASTTKETINIDSPDVLFVGFPTAKYPELRDSEPATAVILVESPITALKGIYPGSYEYAHLKTELLRNLVQIVFENHFPDAKQHIVHTDISTMVSTERFLRKRDGSSYGIGFTCERFMLAGTWKEWGWSTSSDVSNLYFTGADTLIHGISGATWSALISFLSMGLVQHMNHLAFGTLRSLLCFD